MNMRVMILAGLLGSTMLAGTAFAADLSNLPLAAKQGDRAAVQSLLNGVDKNDLAGAEGTAALVWAASRKFADGRSSVARWRRRKECQ